MPEKKLKFELVDLDRHRFENTPEMVDVMRYYQGRLKDEDVVNRDPTITHPSGYQFVGVSDCAKCHTKAHSKWSESRHAHAFESLLKGGKEYEGGMGLPNPRSRVSGLSHDWLVANPLFTLRFGIPFTSRNSPLTPSTMRKLPSALAVITVNWRDNTKRIENRSSLSNCCKARREVQLTEVKAVKTVCIRCHDGGQQSQIRV